MAAERQYIDQRKATGEIVRDPVCGMDVDIKAAAGTSEYKGKKYYFCAKACKIQFDKDPEKYMAR